MDKTVTSRMEQQAERLRRAVASDDFDAAESCACAYGDLIRAELGQMQPAEAAGCLSSAMALLESSRRTVCAARAGLLAELGELQRRMAYQAALPAEAVYTWRLEG